MAAYAPMNFAANSGSYSAAQILETPVPSSKQIFWKIPSEYQRVGGGVPGPPGTTCSGSYTYYQRVFDDHFLFWCYYSGSTVNAAPGITDTTPNNSGVISGHSITYTTSEIVCS